MTGMGNVHTVTGFTVAGDNLTISTSTSAITRVQNRGQDYLITHAKHVKIIFFMTQLQNLVLRLALQILLLRARIGTVRSALI